MALQSHRQNNRFAITLDIIIPLYLLYLKYRSKSTKGSELKMNKIEIIRELEMDQVEYLNSILSQLQDNVNDIDELYVEYRKTKNENDLNFFLYEFERLRNRQESMFNLSKTLLSDIHDNVETAMRELFKLEVKDD